MTRLRRQMHRRIQVVLAQRRVDSPPTVRAGRPHDDQPAPPGGSGQPAPED